MPRNLIAMDFMAIGTGAGGVGLNSANFSTFPHSVTRGHHLHTLGGFLADEATATTRSRWGCPREPPMTPGQRPKPRDPPGRVPRPHRAPPSPTWTRRRSWRGPGRGAESRRGGWSTRAGLACENITNTPPRLAGTLGRSPAPPAPNLQRPPPSHQRPQHRAGLVGQDTGQRGGEDGEGDEGGRGGDGGDTEGIRRGHGAPGPSLLRHEPAQRVRELPHGAG